MTGLIPQQREHVLMDPRQPLSLAVGVAHTRIAATPVAGGVRVATARAVVVLDSSVRELYPPARYGAGDLEGLRRVGAGARPLPVLPADRP